MSKFNVLATISAIIVFAAQSKSSDEQWNEFKSKYARTYSNPQEESLRRQIFDATLRNIEEQNSKYESDQTSFKIGINGFADRTDDEIEDLTRSVQLPRFVAKSRYNSSKSLLAKVGNTRPSNTFDWRSRNIKTPRFNERESCKASWALATADAIDHHYLLHFGTVITSSRQQLIDCDFFSDGCQSGWAENAFEYIRKNGINRNADYSYVGRQNEGCLSNRQRVTYQIKDWDSIPVGREDLLADILVEVGPVVAQIHASASYAKHNGGAIFYDDDCKNTEESLSRAVLILGYGQENDYSYWIAKDSIDDSCWGEDGYIKLSKDRNNHCGVATAASYPILK